MRPRRLYFVLLLCVLFGMTPLLVSTSNIPVTLTRISRSTSARSRISLDSSSRMIISEVQGDIIAEAESMTVQQSGIDKKVLTVDPFAQFTGREIAARADNMAIDFILPSGQKRPFRIKSFADLDNFIQSPEAAEGKNLCMSGAAAAWFELLEATREDVRRIMDATKLNFPELINSIRILKEAEDVVIGVAGDRKFFSPYDLEMYYRSNGNDQLANAVECCSDLLVSIYDEIDYEDELE